MSLVRLVIKLNENRFLLRGGRRIMIHSRAVGISENPEETSSYVVDLLRPLPPDLIRVNIEGAQKSTLGQISKQAQLKKYISDHAVLLPK